MSPTNDLKTGQNYNGGGIKRHKREYRNALTGTTSSNILNEAADSTNRPSKLLSPM